MKKQYQELFSQDKENFRNSQNIKMNLSRKSQCDFSKYKNLPCYSIRNSFIESNMQQIGQSMYLRDKARKKNQNKVKSQRKIKMLTQSDLGDPQSQSYNKNFQSQTSNQSQQSLSILIQQSGFLEHKQYEESLIIKFQQLSLKSKRSVSLNDYLSHLRMKKSQNISYNSIKKLIIKNGNIRLLNGIEKFQNLQEINLKNNDIRQIEQIYKISRPEKLKVLNFKGNDIEDFFNARYENLIKFFPNLIELNDKDYSILKIKKKQQKKINMKKILRKTANVERELMKTLKRQTKQNTKYLYKNEGNKNECSSYYHEDALSRQYNSNVSPKSDSRLQTSRSPSNSKQTKNYSKSKIQYRNNPISQYQGYNQEIYNNQTERQKTQQMQHQNYCENEISPRYCMNYLETEPNSNNLKTPLKEVSLGNIQNVPLIMSSKGQNKSRKKGYIENNNQFLLLQKNQNSNRLMINTSQIDDSHRIMLTQPTATFAMQKQKQRQFDNGQTKHFMFKTLNNKQNVQQSKHFNNKSNLNSKSEKNYEGTVKSENRIERYFEEPEFYEMDSQISLGGISKISYNCNQNVNNNNVYDQPTKRLQRNSISNASFFTTVKETQHQSNLAHSQCNLPNQRNSHIPSYQNQSYVTSFTKMNQSMDQNCFLKQNKTQIERAQEETAIAFYLNTLRQKTFFVLMQYCKKRKDMPRKRAGF